ncbi:GTP cyclohydrolase II [Nitrogeniibacter mangrovi]|uniref:GTP cyclohydrolase-2 n=1 Tax=Nitrogeniibacter mangrovi TaxID=2016596 RepID=A0A6C1B0C5_9RHOO|nr:GTP cyclohydrolase II [Nitrogeniibacter mangrovi]QID16449.1 GTP cyclohydrolase II [Nitrogeniibacter mangrovi]
MTLRFVDACRLPNRFGEFTLHGFEDEATGIEHLALTHGDVTGEAPVLARIHSECLTGDGLFSERCDCGYQLEAAMRRIVDEGRGVILYLRQEGRGIGLLNKIRAYKLQDQGADTVEANELLGFPADMRDFSICKPMLDHLGVRAVRLMTNNPRKLDSLADLGLHIVERVPLQVGRNPHNTAYLDTKAAKLGHLMKPAKAYRPAPPDAQGADEVAVSCQVQ